MNIWQDFVKLIYHYEEVPSLGFWLLVVGVPRIYEAQFRRRWGWVMLFHLVLLLLFLGEYALEDRLFGRGGGWGWLAAPAVTVGGSLVAWLIWLAVSTYRSRARA